MRKGIAVIGALLMIGAALPSVAGHWGVGEGQKTTTTGVAGTVVGYAGPSIVGTGGAVALALADIHCDAEYLGPLGVNNPTNEVEIDENATGGSVPDNTWNDGGHGGACHRASYRTSAFNTQGCGERTDHGEARANTPVLLVFLAAGCDLGSISSNQDPVAAGLGTSICLANNVLEFTPGELPQCVDPLLSPPWSGFSSCRTDGASDSLSFGYATASFGPSVPTKTATQIVAGGNLDCSNTAGATYLFVHANLDLQTSSISGPAQIDVWTTGTGGGGGGDTGTGGGTSN